MRRVSLELRLMGFRGAAMRSGDTPAGVPAPIPPSPAWRLESVAALAFQAVLGIVTGAAIKSA